MNRLQKKCFIAATGMHLLLVLILIVGPAFLSSSSKPDDSKVLDMIPANLIDGKFSGGGGNPSPAPPPVSPPPQAPVQPAPKPLDPVKVSQPIPAPVKPEIKPVIKPTPESLEATKPIKPKPQVSTQLATRNTNDSKAAAAAAAAANAAAARRAADLNTSLRNLRTGLNSKTDIKTSPGLGGSGEAYASYETAIRSIYDAAWIEPHNSTSEDATAEVTIVIARDGTVISARITKPSGDSYMDASIQRALDNVKSVPPFPPTAKDAQRSYIIPFNLKTKRLSA